MAYSSLAALFTAIADAIRSKTGSAAAIVANDFPTAIAAIPTSGVDVSDTTAAAGDVMSGKKFHLANGTLATGSIQTNTLAAPTLSRSGGTITATETMSAGYTAGGTKTATLTLPTKAAETVQPGTSEKTAVSSGTLCTGNIKVGAIPFQTAGGTYYATTSAQTIVASPKYMTSDVKLGKLTQTNLTAANIKSGVTVKINNGSTDVWSVTGTAPIRKSYYQTLTPTQKKSFVCSSNTGMSSINAYYVSFNPGFTPSVILCVCTTETLWRASYDSRLGTYVLMNESGNYYACSSGWTITSTNVLIPVAPNWNSGLSFYVSAWA